MFVKFIAVIAFVCGWQQCVALHNNVVHAVSCSVIVCFRNEGIQEDYRMHGYDGIKFSKLSANSKKSFENATKHDLKIGSYINNQMANNSNCSGQLYRYEDLFFAGFYRKRISRSLLFHMQPAVCEAMLTELYDSDPFLIINGSDDNIIRYMTPLSSATTHSSILLLEHLIGAERSKCINLNIKDILGNIYKTEFQFEFPPAPVIHNPLLVSFNNLSKQVLERFYIFLKNNRTVNYDNVRSIVSSHSTNETFQKLLKCLNDNKQLLKTAFKKETQARGMVITDEIERQALNLGTPALLIQLQVPNIAVVIRSLFPSGMFHMFSDTEDSLMIHLHPEKQGFWNSVWNKIVYKTISQEDKMFWLECIVGVMRSRAIKDYIKQPISKVSFSKFLGLENIQEPVSIATPPKQSIMCSGISPVYGPVISNLDYIDLASKVVRSIYTDEGLGSKIDPEMSNSNPPNWSIVKPEAYKALVDAFVVNRTKISKEMETALKATTIKASEEELHFLIDKIAGGLILTIHTDHAIALIRALFPEGQFHLFNGAEYELMNHLEPTGRDLTTDERLLWLKCLAGARRAKSINEDIANPVKGFGLEVFPQYKIIEEN